MHVYLILKCHFLRQATDTELDLPYASAFVNVASTPLKVRSYI